MNDSLPQLNLKEVVWIIGFFNIMVLNSIREIVYYGFRGLDVPFISYWGYVFLFSFIIALPFILKCKK